MLLNCGVGKDSWEFLSKEIKPVNPKGNQSWIFIGRTDVEVEAPILWPPDAKSQLIRKDPDAGKDWGQEEKGTTEDEMVGWPHWPNGHGFEQTQEIVKDREAWCAAVYGIAELDTTYRLNNNMGRGSPLLLIQDIFIEHLRHIRTSNTDSNISKFLFSWRLHSWKVIF